MQQARATMHRIGKQLIDERTEEVLKAASKPPRHVSPLLEGGKEKTIDEDEDLDERTKGRDLLSVLSMFTILLKLLSLTSNSVLVRSNASPTLPASQKLTLPETLSQISTFLAAGHETTGSALTWTLYVLAKNETGCEVQRKLRRELREIHHLHSAAVPSGSCTEEELSAVLNNSYLDAVVRESLRVNSPITTTMRLVSKDDFIPVSSPLLSSRPGFNDSLTSGSTNAIRVNKGDIISIPIQAINKNKEIYGEDVDEFRPERWLDSSEKNSPSSKRGAQGLWGGILTFLNGNPMNGNRACIGYRFSINEYVHPLFPSTTEADTTIANVGSRSSCMFLSGISSLPWMRG